MNRHESEHSGKENKSHKSESHKSAESKNIIAWSLILISFALAIYFYPKMPEQMASHWNIAGEPDAYMPKFWALFIMPVLAVIMLLAMRWLPKLDPLKDNVQHFKEQYNTFIIVLISFLLYLYGLTLFWNSGIQLNIVKLLVPGFAVLFYYVGILLENIKRNWFIGIRTPWTMSSDAVWEKTHDFGGRLFKIAAYIMLLGVFFEKAAFFLVLIPLLMAVIIVVVYSYYEYKKHG